MTGFHPLVAGSLVGHFSERTVTSKDAAKCTLVSTPRLPRHRGGEQDELPLAPRPNPATALLLGCRHPHHEIPDKVPESVDLLPPIITTASFPASPAASERLRGAVASGRDTSGLQSGSDVVTGGRR